MPREMIEYGRKIEEKMKAMQSEIKENVQGTNMTGRKLGLKSMIWARRKKLPFNQNTMKKQEFKKMRRGLGTSGTTLSIPTSESWGCWKEKRNRKKLKTYLNK